MKKAFLLAVLLLMASCAQDKVCYEQKCFQVEVVDTPDERALGLMHREHLEDDRGMLFIFEQVGVYPFWMKNTLIPLDIIWINHNKRVVYISRNTQPCKEDPCPSYDPGKQAKYVLEVNAGTADEIGLEEGDKLTFHLS